MTNTNAGRIILLLPVVALSLLLVVGRGLVRMLDRPPESNVIPVIPDGIYSGSALALPVSGPS